MKRTSLTATLISLLLFIGCTPSEKMVKLTTEAGDVTIKLYNETPKHRDNFLKLTKDGYYDGLLFHRVINEFMIQGGDPDSRNAEAGARLGNGGPGYRIDAEIQKGLFHKKGAIAAARTGDRNNPERRSSGSQFYIVHGKVFTNDELDKLEEKKNNDEFRRIFQQMMTENKDSMVHYQRNGDIMAISDLRTRLEQEADSLVELDPFKFSEEAREVYTTIGGTPHLDGAYTIFGEVVEGFSTIDSIAGTQTDHFDRPVENISMKIEKL